MWKGVLILLLGLVLFGPANAQPKEDNTDWNKPGCFRLADSTGPFPPTPIEGTLLGYCRGVIISLMATGRTQKTKPICAPIDGKPDAILRQAALIVLAYMEKKPDTFSWPLVYVASDALSEAWPCKE